MRYAALAEVVISHGFYADGVCPDLAIEAVEETARLLRGHRCSLSARPGSLRIIMALDSAGKPLLPLPEGVTLRFRLHLRNPEFELFTELPAGRAGRDTARLLFTNKGAEQGQLRAVGVLSQKPAEAPACFAAIEICLEGEAGRANTPRSFHLGLQAKRARWVYYCLTDLPASAGELRILDGTPRDAEEPLRFDAGTAPAPDARPAPADPIALRLAEQHPGLRCIRLISDREVVCRQYPRKQLELRLGDERLTGPLPIPALRSMTPDGLLFQVIKYRNQTFSNS
jgi:hypothetical protein